MGEELEEEKEFSVNEPINASSGIGELGRWAFFILIICGRMTEDQDEGSCRVKLRMLSLTR